MTDMDYSKTGIFERHTNLETKNKNAELYAMYQAFYKKMRTEAKSSEVNLCGYNGVQLLTCFDSYLTADNQIMIYGKEAHTDEGCVFDFSPEYQNDGYYKYEYKIAHVGEDGIAKSACPHTDYLKTRELIARFDKKHEPEEREAEILSVLSNNLNKTSLGGGHTEYPLEVGGAFPAQGVRLNDQEETGVIQAGVAEIRPGAVQKAHNGELGPEGSYGGKGVGAGDGGVPVYDGYVVKRDGLEGTEGYHLEGDIGIHIAPEFLHNLAARPGLDPRGLHSRKRRQEYNEYPCQDFQQYAETFFHRLKIGHP